MPKLRERLLAANVRRDTLTLPVGDGGAAITVEVRGVTAGARGRILNAARTDNGTLDFERYYAHLVIETAHDPESGEPLFAAADLEAVNALPSPLVAQLAELAEALSGLGAENSEALEKNSAALPSDGTASSSPSALGAQ